VLVGSFSLLFLHSTPAQALSGSDWSAGRIIDDAIFFDKTTMTSSQIQQFLDAKVPVCDRNRPSSNPSYQPPWTCLKEYQENITTKENNIGKFNADGSPKSITGGKTAAQIIWEVAQQYGINPQVLIVMLQKEQSLITDNWPWKVQYQKAMGYACPDTAPCDEQYYGFYNQVSSAAWQLKRYVNYPDNYNFKAGVTRYIQYNPSASCGGSNVYIENPATAALYNYTPYQPNSGALANLNGSADCGAYGNRNFWKYFNDWFGTTRIHFINFSSPRWMQLNKDTYKISATNLQQVDSQLLSGRQLKFVEKVYLNGYWCYRTESDANNFIPKCIPASDISELQITYEPLLESEKYNALTISTNKNDIRTGVPVGDLLSKDFLIKYNSKFKVGPNEYYITEHDKSMGFEYGVLVSKLRMSSSYESIIPKWYSLNQETKKVYPTTTTPVDDALPNGLEKMYTSRTNVGGKWYYRTEADTKNGLDKAISEDYLEPIEYLPFSNPRWMTLKNNTFKIITSTGKQVDTKLTSGKDIKFTSKITIKGILYYRSAYDTDNNTDKGIPANLIEEIIPSALTYPRWMEINENTNKTIANTGVVTLNTVNDGEQYKFTSKITVGSKLYFRTESDTANGNNLWIDASKISDISYVPMVHPRKMKTTVSTYKVNPLSGQNVDTQIASNTYITNTSKITVNGITYLRSQNDTSLNLDKGIRLTDLQ
jgi:hypothetical protein